MAGLGAYGSSMEQAGQQGLQGMKLDRFRQEQMDLARQKEADEAFRLAAQDLMSGGRVDYGKLQQLATVFPERAGPLINALQAAKPPQAPSVNLQYDPKTGTIFNPGTGELTYTQGAQQSGLQIPENATPEQLANIYLEQGKALSAKDPVEAKRYFDLAEQINPKVKPEKPTEGQLTASGYFSRMNSATEIINPLEDKGQYPMYAAAFAGLVPLAGGVTQRLLMTPEQQQYKQAADDWIRAKLRKESGAVIGADEMRQEYETYFPQPGDKKEVIEQKRKSREIATQAMATSAGPAKPANNVPTTGPKRYKFNPSTGQIEEQ
jgi:hypothetical protein